MKTKILLFFFVLAAVTARAQTDPALDYLPANASRIITMNLHKLRDKIGKETLLNSAFVQKIMQGADKGAAALIQETAERGLDLSSNMYVVVMDDSVAGYPAELIYYFGKLSNRAKLETALKESNKEKIVKSKGNLTVQISWEKTPLSPPASFAYNDEIYIYTTGKFKGSRDYEQFTARKEELKKQKDLVTEQRINSLFQLLGKNAGQGSAADPRFLAALNPRPDLLVWDKASNGGLLNYLFKSKQIETSENNRPAKEMLTSLFFETGKIRVESQQFPGAGILPAYEKNPATVQSDQLFRHLPAGKPIMVLSASLNPGLLEEIRNRTGLMNQPTAGKADKKKRNDEPEFDFKLISEATGNQVLLAMIEPDDKKTFADEFDDNRAATQVFLAFPILNRAKFIELKKSVLQLKAEIQKNNKTGDPFKNLKVYFKETDSLAVIAVSEKAGEYFLQHQNETIPAWFTQYQSEPMIVHADIKFMADYMQEKMAGSGRFGAVEHLLMSMFNTIQIHGGKYNKGVITTTTEITMSDEQSNALKQITETMDVVLEAQARKQENAVADDGEMIEPPPPIADTTAPFQLAEPPPPPPPPPVMLKEMDENSSPFVKVEVEAKYRGDWKAFLTKNLSLETIRKNNPPPGSYTVVVMFIVNKQGEISDIKSLSKHGYGMEEEAERLIRLSGKWKPAEQNGKEVIAYRRQPITFVID